MNVSYSYFLAKKEPVKVKHKNMLQVVLQLYHSEELL